MNLGHRDILSTAQRFPSLLLSLLFFWIWQLSFFQGPTYLASKPTALPETLPMLLPFLISNGLMYLILSLRWRKVPALYEGKRFDGACGALISIGTGLSLGPSFAFFGSDAGQLACFYVGSLLMGSGAALLNIQLGFLVARVQQRVIPCLCVCSIVGGSIALAAVVQLPVSIRSAVLVLVPLASVLFMRRARNKTRARAVYSLGSGSRPNLPKRYLATAFMHGISMGAIFALASFQADSVLDPLVQPVSFLLGAVLVGGSVYGARMDYNGLLYKVGIPIIAFGLLVIALVPNVMSLGSSIYLIGYCFINVIMICLNMYFVTGLGFSPVYIIGFSTLLMVCGELTGLALGTLSLTAFGSQTGFLLLGCSIAFGLPVGALYCLNERNMLSGWGSVKIEDSVLDRPHEAAQRLVVAEYGLSAREAEILGLVARGNTRKGMASALHLSEDTVKSYLRNLYAKLGVHSKQEVMDLLEREKPSS